jgi:hypothetical protein
MTEVERKVRGLQGLVVAWHGEPKGWREKDGSSWPAWSEVFAGCDAVVMRRVIVEDLGEVFGSPRLRDVVRAYEERMGGGTGPVVRGERVEGEERERVVRLLGELAGGGKGKMQNGEVGMQNGGGEVE